MATLREWIRRFWGTLRPDPRDRELEEELRLHLELAAEDVQRRGGSRQGAVREARLQAGGIVQAMEALREQRGLPWLDDLGRDLRHGIRALRRSPAFTAVALLTLAVGIGAGTAIFSLVNTVLLRPLPVTDPARLVVLWEDVTAAGFPRNTPAPANYVDWKVQNQTFEDIAAASWQTFNLTGSGEPERLTGLRVTANFLTLLGVKPALGRLMLPTEDDSEIGSVAVISHGLWQRKFGSDPNLVGRSLNLNGQPYTVVGVAPNGFQFPATGANVWIAPAFTPREIAQRGNHYLFVIGRLKAGVSLNQARADMATIANRLEAEYPQTNKGVGVTVVPLRDHYVGDLRLALNLLLAAVGALLLIACANLANLFLARGATRQREIAMRAALGAGRARIMRQLLTECTEFALIAAVLGAALSIGGFGFLARLIPESFPEGTALHFDWRVFCFTTGMAVLTATLFGAAPAVQAWRLDLNAALKGAGRSDAHSVLGKLRGTVVIAEVAFTVVLLVVAGLLLTSYSRLRGVDTGFRAENVLTLETPLPPAKYGDPARRAEFYREVIERTTRHPGVVSAGYVNWPPLTMKGGTNGFVIEGRPRPRPGEGPDANNRAATADYLRTIGVPLLRGRYSDERDGPNGPLVVVINQTMARTYWPGEEALGARIRFGDGGPAQPPYTIIGIVGDVKQMGLDAPSRPEMYFPVTQQAPGGSFFWPRTLVVRTAGDPYGLVADIRRAITEVDPDQPVANIRTMNEVLDSEVSGRKIQTTILTAFAISALLLASVGLYGVLSYTVAQRTVEIGIRMALGAQRGELIRGIVTQALRWTAIGAACGLAGAFVLTRIFSALLFDVRPSDPSTYAGATLMLVAVAIIASLVPAWRAATVDPMIALRHE